MTGSFTRTLKLKVRSEAYRWLNAAAIEVNQVFNYCNDISFATATRTDLARKWLSGFDLCNLTAGSSPHFEHIGADTIQRVCTEYAQKRTTAKRLKLRWRVSQGARRSLGWIPFKAKNLRRRGRGVRFCGKSFLRRMLQYKGEHAGRSVITVDESYTSRVCSSCGAPLGPSGLRLLVVRTWQCALCGDWHDRDVNAARNMVGFGSRCWTSVSGNELTQEQLPVEPDIFVRAGDGRVIARALA
jgi:hypothetical protein